MLTLFLLLAPVTPPAALEARDFTVRAEASSDLGTIRALVTLLPWRPTTPEGTWRRRQAINAALAPVLDVVLSDDWAIARLRSDPHLILTDPAGYCAIIDRKRLFWARNSLTWAYIIPLNGSLEKELLVVARNLK